MSIDIDTTNNVTPPVDVANDAVATPPHLDTTPRTIGARPPAIRVGLVAATDSWRPELQAYLEHHVEYVDVLVIRDPYLLVDEHLDLVIIDDAVTLIGERELLLLEDRKIPVVGLFHTDGSGRGAKHLAALGVDHRLRAETDVVDLARLVRTFDPVTDRRTGSGAPAPQVDSPDPTDQPPTPAAADYRLRERRIDHVLSPGRIVTVGGVSERRHEFAALLAAGYGRMHQSMVIDLDPFRPRLARRFRLQLQPNVLVACRSVGPDFDPMHFTGRRGVSAVELPFWSLVGVPSSDAASQIDVDDLCEVIEHMAATWPRLVLVADGATGSAAALPMRTAALRTATSPVVAADPTPEGVLECLDWLVQTDSIDPNRTVDVVFCGRPADRQRRLEIADQLRDHRPADTIRHVVFIPWDDRQVISASWEGRQVARRTAMARSASRFADLLTAGSAKRLEVL